jgi:hypothetical protein
MFLVKYEVTKDMRYSLVYLFADDVVFVDETRVGANRKLELWSQTSG